ncbi:hypothetical protein BHE74_00028320 [Ensete ventricosum]|nr:hypothetical protein BHE74_00028320 [Ensete ventricosum]
MASLTDDEVSCEGTLMLEADDEYIELLLSKENRCCSRARDASSEDSLKSARSDAVRWILKMRVLFGLGMRTAYVAVSYLDHFCVHRSIDSMVGVADHVVFSLLFACWYLQFDQVSS